MCRLPPSMGCAGPPFHNLGAPGIQATHRTRRWTTRPLIMCASVPLVREACTTASRTLIPSSQVRLWAAPCAKSQLVALGHAQLVSRHCRLTGPAWLLWYVRRLRSGYASCSSSPCDVVGGLVLHSPCRPDLTFTCNAPWSTSACMPRKLRLLEQSNWSCWVGSVQVSKLELVLPSAGQVVTSHTLWGWGCGSGFGFVLLSSCSDGRGVT